MNWTAGVVLFIFCSVPLFGAQRLCAVPGQGYFRIHVGTGGFFGAFAHDHSVEAKKIMGCATIDETDVTRSSIKLEFPSADIRVIDPKESEKDRAEVQRTMETEVLRVSEYPSIIFESTAVERTGDANREVRIVAANGFRLAWLAEQLEKHFFGSGADVASGYVPPQS